MRRKCLWVAADMRSLALSAVLPILIAASALYGQQPVAISASAYVSTQLLPAPVRSYVAVFGKRIQKPGQERTTLTGTYTDQSGSGPARLVWQAPGSLRFERPNSKSTLIYAYGSAATAATGNDANVMESLLDDAAESFFYGLRGGSAYRLLGQRFRSDDGKTANFQGPWYDIYEVAASPRSQPGNIKRWKTYHFDSETKLLSMIKYTDSAGVHVTTEFNKWSSLNGEAFPGQIVRIENGTTIFTFTVTGASVGPGVVDQAFKP